MRVKNEDRRLSKRARGECYDCANQAVAGLSFCQPHRDKRDARDEERRSEIAPECAVCNGRVFTPYVLNGAVLCRWCAIREGMPYDAPSSELDSLPDPDEPTIDAPACSRCHLRLYLTPRQVKNGETHVCLPTSQDYAGMRRERI